MKLFKYQIHSGSYKAYCIIIAADKEAADKYMEEEHEYSHYTWDYQGEEEDFTYTGSNFTTREMMSMFTFRD